MQDYKSQCAAVMICSTLVNIQTHTQTDSIWPAYMKSSASWAKNFTIKTVQMAEVEPVSNGNNCNIAKPCQTHSVHSEKAVIQQM